jgi:hypothetical protein
MKTKTLSKYLMVAATVGLLFTACKKNKDEVTPTPAASDDATEQAVAASDQSRVESESNASMDDANNAIEGVSTTRSVAGIWPNSLLCGVTADTSQKAFGLIVLNYSGNNCYNTVSRSGSISIQLPYSSTSGVTRWKVQGSSVILTFNNYTVTNLNNGKSLKFNGTHTITNVSGGVVADLITNPSVPRVHRIRANMTLTFDDNTSRVWQAARTRTFSATTSGTNITIAASVAGDTTISGISNVAMWGINRNGVAFDISIPTPVVYNIYGSTCLYKPLSGVRIHKKLTRELTVTYGVESDGTPTVAGNCPYGYKLNWINAQGVAKQVVISY